MCIQHHIKSILRSHHCLSTRIKLKNMYTPKKISSYKNDILSSPEVTRRENSSSPCSVIPTTNRKSHFKKKIEMCKSVLLGAECSFGRLCTYAHHESELQLRTLKERHDAGLIDASTYRTRPCFDHVATGAW